MCRDKRVAPYCCYFTENPSGEFWKGLLQSAVKIAPSIMAMVPDPRVKAAAAAFSAMEPSISAMLAENGDKKAKRKQKNAQEKYGPGMKKNRNRMIVPKKNKVANGQFQPPHREWDAAHAARYDPPSSWENNTQIKKPNLKSTVRPVKRLGNKQ